jgi:hypothetical protein
MDSSYQETNSCGEGLALVGYGFSNHKSRFQGKQAFCGYKI